jgi:hypothetical protein
MVASGISMAEDPTNGKSFGQHRSRILAESLWEIYEKKIDSIDEKVQEVVQHFQKAGINVHTPYLNVGSLEDDYDFLMKGLFNPN